MTRTTDKNRSVFFAHSSQAASIDVPSSDAPHFICYQKKKHCYAKFTMSTIKSKKKGKIDDVVMSSRKRKRGRPRKQQVEEKEILVEKKKDDEGFLDYTPFLLNDNDLVEDDDVRILSVGLGSSSSSFNALSSSCSSSSSSFSILSSSSSTLTSPLVSIQMESSSSKYKKQKTKLKLNIRTLPEVRLTKDQKSRGQYYIRPDLIMYSIILICEDKKNVLALTEMESYILVEPVLLLSISSYFKILLDPAISSNGDGAKDHEDEDDVKRLIYINNFSETVIRSTLYLAEKVYNICKIFENKRKLRKSEIDCEEEEKEEEEEEEIPFFVREVRECDEELTIYSFELLIQMAEFAHQYLDFKPLEKRFENLIQFVLKKKSNNNKKNNKHEEDEREEEEKKNNSNNFNDLILNLYSSKIHPSSKATIKKLYMLGKYTNESFHTHLRARLKETMNTNQQSLFDLFCECFNGKYKRKIEKWEFKKDLDILNKLYTSKQGTWSEILIENRNKKLFSGNKTVSEFFQCRYQGYCHVLKQRKMMQDVDDEDDDDNGYDVDSQNKVMRWINILKMIYPEKDHSLYTEETQTSCSISLLSYVKPISN